MRNVEAAGGNVRTIGALHGCAEKHLQTYTDPRGPRAFRTYDWQGDPERLSPLDCLAPSLLSVRIGYKQVVPLFHPDGPGAEVLQAMEAVLANEACATADFLDVTLDPLTRPWSLVDRALVATGEAGGTGLPDFKAVAVTKILHRKRPNLCRFSTAAFTSSTSAQSQFPEPIRTPPGACGRSCKQTYAVTGVGFKTS